MTALDAMELNISSTVLRRPWKSCADTSGRRSSSLSLEIVVPMLHTTDGSSVVVARALSQRRLYRIMLSSVKCANYEQKQCGSHLSASNIPLGSPPLHGSDSNVLCEGRRIIAGGRRMSGKCVVG